MINNFSIILPSLGNLDLLKSFLDSLVRHQGRNYEVCVGLDPARTDDPSDFLVSRGVKFAWSQSPGMSAATNTAFSLSTGMWIIILADDMVALPHWDCFEQVIRPNRILCFSLLEPFPGSFPPSVPAGDSPEIFDWKTAEVAAESRWRSETDFVYPGRHFGTWLLHQSKFVLWPEWCDPYTMNDISFSWELHLTHPEVAFGWLPRHCLYHFVQGSIKHHPELAPNGYLIGKQFVERYGLGIGQAYQTLHQHSEAIWTP